MSDNESDEFRRANHKRIHAFLARLSGQLGSAGFPKNALSSVLQDEGSGVGSTKESRKKHWAVPLGNWHAKVEKKNICYTAYPNQGTKIVGLGYDGRKDKTRAMLPDSYGKLHPRLIREEHVSVTEEPSRRYLWHFVPEDPVPPEKPAFKVARALLYGLLVTYDSTDSLIVLQDAPHSPVARVHVDQKAWTDWQRTEHPGNPIKYCLQVYFKLYYDIKGLPQTRGRPQAHPTQLRR
ncbi:hypothetical protein GWK47_028755 [Chionoecetes opilio]|uniref:Uncharacterized protein n=1 Tax=Chionoecetes opilio TaxID=41210 RepID=A0A8J4YYH3_CHIOP|nr:hypothetical protein GWK47_028755 [Chionoecetes opilio]